MNHGTGHVSCLATQKRSKKSRNPSLILMGSQLYGARALRLTEKMNLKSNHDSSPFLACKDMVVTIRVDLLQSWAGQKS